MVDAGVSGVRIERALGSIGRRAEELSGILVTHEHTDHIAGVFVLARRYRLKVYATRGTWGAMCHLYKNPDRSLIKIVEEGKGFFVGDLGIKAFSIPHDAAQPVGYNFFEDDLKITVATDIGMMDENLFSAVAGSHAVLLESNHDVKMLENGPYPYVLKKRIKSDVGHLSNDEAAAVCARLVSLGTRRIILGHLSGSNNTPELAYSAACASISRSGARIGCDVFLDVAQRDSTGALMSV